VSTQKTQRKKERDRELYKCSRSFVNGVKNEMKLKYRWSALLIFALRQTTE